MNHWTGIGRLTKDPDFRENEVNENSSFCRFTIAVDRRFVKDRENQQTADFISCVAFGRQGEFAEKYLHQGTKIAVTGRIQTGSYTNKDGQKVYTTEVVVEEQEFAESKASSDSQGGGYVPQDAPSTDAASAEGFMNIPQGVNDDLPFKK